MTTTEELVIRLQNLDRKGGLGYEAHDLLKLAVERLEAFSGDPNHEMMSAGHRQMAYVDCTPRAVWNAMRSVAVAEPQDQAAQATRAVSHQNQSAMRSEAEPVQTPSKGQET